MDIILGLFRFIWILFLVLMVFNLLIIVHEWGHFLAGRWRGLKIDRFQIWFGKPIWRKTWNGVQYGLGSVPFGGFVSLPQMAPMEAIEGAVAGEMEGEEKKEPLPPISPLDKIIVAFAGPLFSFLLACFFAVIVWMVGKPVPDQATARVVGYVEKGLPAAEAGIRPGDEILAVDGNEVARIHGMIDSMDWFVIADEDATAEFKIRRDGEILTKTVQVPREKSEQQIEQESKRRWWQKARSFVFDRPPLPDVGIYGREKPRVGKISPNSPAEEAGIQPADLILAIDGKEVFHRIQIGEHIRDKPVGEPVALTMQRKGTPVEVTVTPRVPEKRPESIDYPMMGVGWDVFGKGEIKRIPPSVQISESLQMIKNTLGAIFSPNTKVGATHLSSAVGIMRLYYRLFEHPDGWRLVLWFSVVLNVNLAVLNMLPFPVLDGGHIVMATAEAVRRKPMNLKVLEVVQTAAVILLLGLMVVLVFKDVGDIAADSRRPTIEFLPRDVPAESS